MPKLKIQKEVEKCRLKGSLQAANFTGICIPVEKSALKLCVQIERMKHIVALKMQWIFASEHESSVLE